MRPVRHLAGATGGRGDPPLHAVDAWLMDAWAATGGRGDPPLHAVRVSQRGGDFEWNRGGTGGRRRPALTMHICLQLADRPLDARKWRAVAERNALPSRKVIRLRGYDYSLPGEYFITICTLGKKCALGRVDDGVARLNCLGRMIESA